MFNDSVKRALPGDQGYWVICGWDNEQFLMLTERIWLDPRLIAIAQAVFREFSAVSRVLDFSGAYAIYLLIIYSKEASRIVESIMHVVLAKPVEMHVIHGP